MRATGFLARVTKISSENAEEEEGEARIERFWVTKGDFFSAGALIGN